jgi:hypothetical protein
MVSNNRRFSSTPDRLIRTATRYHRETQKCLRGKAYLAAVVMQVAILEASLQAMCAIYADAVKGTVVYQKKRFRKKRNRALEFNLSELISIARELRWFPLKQFRWAGKRADVAGFTHEVRKLRNFVHPSRMAMERGDPTNFSKGVYDVVHEVFDVSSS